MRTSRALLYASSVGAMGLGVRSVVRGPVPLSVAAASMAAFGAIVLAGVLDPRLAMYADVVNEGEASPESPRLALTFDDGPSSETTPRVLDLLDEAGARGTFFVVGRKLGGAGAALARDAVARGHAVGCHSFAHDRLFALRGSKRVRADLVAALRAIEDATGASTRVFRPPVAHTNPIIARVAADLGLTVVGFSVRAYDGLRSARAANVTRRVVRGVRDGAIVLMHDCAERDDFRSVVADVLPDVLSAMRAKRVRGVTVPEMLSEPSRCS